MLTGDQIKDGKDFSFGSALFKLGTSAALSTPLMMLQMAFFQLISGDSQGWPTIRTMMACIVIYLIVIYADLC